MRGIQEYGERNGRPMGFSDLQTRTLLDYEPEEVCLRRIFSHISMGTVFTEQSRETDRLVVTVFEESEGGTSKSSRTPLATLKYNKHGIYRVVPPYLLA